jgi:TonB family protein
MNHLSHRIVGAALHSCLMLSSGVTLHLLYCAFYVAGISAYAQVSADASGQQALELFNAKQYAAAKDQATAGSASGSVVSMYVLGEIYSSGKGAAQDYPEAANWFRKAADAGYAPAMNALGSAHEAGHGVEQNLAMAAGWYRRSAEKGDGMGMNNLGHMFEIGGGVPKEYAQAFAWYLKGAEAGAAAAMVNVGVMYENGHAVTQGGQSTLPDFGEALKWYEKAAHAGDAGGMYRLALSYDIGKGTAPDRSLAMEWYRKAADAGSEPARARLGNDTSGSQPAVANPVPALAGQGAAVPDRVYLARNPVTQPSLVSKVEPEYSEVARKLRAEGSVVLQIVVAADGAPGDFKVVRSLGYGLDEKAIEAVGKWRFKPGMKDGNAVAVAATLEVPFGFGGPPNPSLWYSGALAFAHEDGLTPPAVKDGTVLKPGGEAANESVVLEFTVDPSGSAKNIHSTHGSQSSSELLTRTLATWKFRPAMRGERSVETTGRVSFTKGQGDDAAKSPPPPATQDSGFGPNAAPSTGGAVLTPLDPATVDDNSSSINSNTPALIDFVNRSGRPIDMYWINYQGDRAPSVAGLAAGSTFSAGTYLTHPFLIVVSGTGGTTEQDTGTRLAAFEAVTPNPTRDRAKRDIAIITDPVAHNAPVGHVGGCVAPPSGLVGWWSGDSDENDIAGGHNPSAVNAVSLVPGEVGNGFRFGNQGGIEIPDSPDLKNQQFTWMAWVRPDGPGPNNDGNGSVIVSQSDGRTASTNLQWRATDNRFLFFFGLIASERIESKHTFAPGAFYLVAGTYDGSAFRLFVNGVLEGSFGRVKAVPYASSPWKIGSTGIHCIAYCRTWNGVIDEVQAYDRALSVMEIFSIFQAGSAGVCKGAASVAAAPSAPTAALPASSDTRQVRTMVNSKDGQVYVWIPPGSFTMGCSGGDTECDANEKPPHVEQIEKGFWLGQTEVTQAAYQTVTGGNPSADKGDQLPVEGVTWDDALKYCSAVGGNLPSEVEWEYAARAGTKGARYGSPDAIAWHAGNSGGSNQPVGQKQANAFGLFDMLGNAWEWMEDSYEDTPSKILRGGSSFDAAFNARASRRVVTESSASSPDRGFRCGGQWPEPKQTPANLSATLPAPAGVAPGTAGPDGVYRIGNGVSPQKLLRKVEPRIFRTRSQGETCRHRCAPVRYWRKWQGGRFQSHTQLRVGLGRKGH